MVVELNANEEIYVDGMAGSQLRAGARATTFSGMLLYPSV